MTYDFFKELLSYGEEFVIYYENKKFYISQRKDLDEIYFTISENEYYIFHDVEELLSKPLIDFKTLLEIWDELDIY